MKCTFAGLASEVFRQPTPWCYKPAGLANEAIFNLFRW